MKAFGFVSILFLAFFVSVAHGQGLPFGAISGDAMMTTFQIESIGPSINSERSYENLTHGKFDVSIPFAQSEVDGYALQVKASRLTLDTDRSTKAANSPIPKDLGSAAIGPFARHKMENGDMIAGDLQLGRSGIQLGSSDTATTVSANFFWARKKDEDEGQWLYLLSYSNSRSSLNGIPVPGFAYMKTIKTASAQGIWAAGAPFFFTLIRSQPWSFTALLTPFAAFVEGGYSFFGPFGAFARFGWQPQGFKVAGGPTERIVYEEFRTVLGVRGPVARWAMVSLGLAYADGRRVAWSDSILKSSDNESRLQDEVSLFFSIGGRF